MATNTLPLIFDGRRYKIGGVYHENIYGLLLFLDALGVKRIWETKDTDEVLRNWNKVYETFYNKLDSQLTGANISAFSDTIIISMRSHKDLIKTTMEIC